MRSGGRACVLSVYSLTRAIMEDKSHTPLVILLPRTRTDVLPCLVGPIYPKEENNAL